MMSSVDGSRPAPLGRAFWRIWSTQTLSVVGSTLSGIGVAVHVYIETGDPRWLGVLTAFAAAPYVLVAPALGRLDRCSRRAMLLLGDGLAAAGPVIALALAVAGRLEVWHLVLAGFLTGVGNAVQTPSLSAVVPVLVPEASPAVLARANGLFQVGPAAGIVVGPALATPLVAWFGVEAVLVVDVITFVIAVAATAMTRFGADAVVRVAADGSGDDGSWRAAFGWLRSEGRPLLVLLVVMGFVNFALSFFNVSYLALATDVGGAALAGTAVALGGMGMIVGSLMTGSVGLDRRPVRVFAVGLVVMGAGCVTAAIRPWFALVVVGVVIALAPVSMLSAGVATLFQTRVPARMHGRVFAVRSTMGRSLDPIGSAVAGFVIADVAAPTMRAGGAGAGVLGGVLGVGAERGAALVLLVAGLTIGALGCWVGVNGRLGELDADLGDGATAGVARGADGAEDVQAIGAAAVLPPLASAPVGDLM
jgi:DHA3 family macrolide efflux protein-like MFS transporter